MKDLNSLTPDKLKGEILYYLDYIMDKQDSISEELNFSYRVEFKEVKAKILQIIDEGNLDLAKSLLSNIFDKFKEVEIKISELQRAGESFKNAMKVAKNA